MLIIRIKKRIIYISVFTLVFTFFATLSIGILPDRKTSMEAFIASSSKPAEISEQIEVFDISAGRVCSRYRNNSAFRKEAVACLESIEGMYVKPNVFPDAGFIIKIPLIPPYHVSGEWLAKSGIKKADTVYVIFPAQEKPYLLILDEQSRPNCFIFSHDAAALNKYIDACRKGQRFETGR